MREIIQYESKISKWRERAKSHRKEKEVVKKRLKEVLYSRSKWRSKYDDMRAKNRLLESQLASLGMPSKEKVRGHKYPLAIIELCLRFRHEAGCSYRSCVNLLLIVSVWLKIEMSVPSASSIRNWDLKLGYKKLKTRCSSEGDSADRVLIVDESINMGSQRILLLLGVKIKTHDFAHALTMEDVDILEIKLKKSWTSDQIHAVIESVKERGFNLIYGCSDNGSNICKALKMSDLEHLGDCGHVLGNLLKHNYLKDETFQMFSKQSAQFKRQEHMSSLAAYVPPVQRSKGRFLNLSPLSKWAKQLLKIVERYNREGIEQSIIEKLEWILPYKDFIKKLGDEQALINQLNKILKEQGLSKKTKMFCEKVVAKSAVEEPFKLKILDYLKRNSEKLPEIENLICSSDIIESIFGLYKNRMGKNQKSGITEGCLTIANYGKKINIIELKASLEEVEIVDLKEWKEKNIPISILQLKNKLFKNAG